MNQDIERIKGMMEAVVCVMLQVQKYSEDLTEIEREGVQEMINESLMEFITEEE